MGKLTGKKVVIIHGWSDSWKSMRKVGAPLAAEGAAVYYANYDSREDKAVYEDFAEGLQKELMDKRLIPGPEKSLNFVTHSTGALVLRQWFRQYSESQSHTGNVVFLAPANFGSPLAAMGKSLIGKIFKGQHGINADLFEVGANMLHGLELASPFAWTLAHHDLFGSNGCIYHKKGIRASVITGHRGYGGFRRFVNKPGTDGTIVVAGANLNARRLILNFVSAEGEGFSWWYGFKVKNENPIPGKVPPHLPFAIHRDLNHATVLKLGRNPVLRQQVVDCLLAGPNEYDRLRTRFGEFTQKQVGTDPDMQYQQFLFHVKDDRGMPVRDYHLEFNVWNASRVRESYPGGPRHVPGGEKMSPTEKRLSGQLDEILEGHVHTHSQDSSYKRYLIHPEQVENVVGKDHVVTIRIDAKSGDKDITYRTGALDNVLLYHPSLRVKVHPFVANTTTVVEIGVDRESRLLHVRRG